MKRLSIRPRYVAPTGMHRDAVLSAFDPALVAKLGVRTSQLIGNEDAAGQTIIGSNLSMRLARRADQAQADQIQTVRGFGYALPER